MAEWLPDGTLTRGRFEPDAAAPIDCFYVYPTVDLRFSMDNASLEDLEEPRRVARAQAALLGQVCRVWAPAYRQVTLGTYFRGESRAAPYFEVASDDIDRAFAEFLAAIGPERRFVVIGHSQGGQQVTRLVSETIERDPALRARMVAAYPIGWRTATAEGSRVGGSFAQVPVCADPEETGCVLAFRTYAAGGLPSRPSDAFAEGRDVVCVNPAAPGTTDHARLRGAVLLLPRSGEKFAAPPGYTAADGLLLVRDAWQARCVPTPDGAGLEVRWSPKPGDTRPDLLELDHTRWRNPMGTHILDLQLTLLDIIEDIRRRAG